MAPLDAKVAEVIDKHADTNTADSDDEDALIDELEKEEAAVFDHFRERRMQELHEEFERAKAARNEGMGTYTEAQTEKEVMGYTTSTKYSIIHFFLPDFRRCKIMDTHLAALAEKHYNTRIVRISVEKAPFLVERLQVRVLPCVISFIDGKSVDRLEGFDLLGNTDNFSTSVLEKHLVACGVFERTKTKEGTNRGIFRTEPEEDDGDDDWD